jgi:hypothetical protein
VLKWKKLKSWQTIALFVSGLIALYYLSIPIIGPHYAEVCRKGEYGPPDSCADWDTVTASVLRIGIWLDEHNGLVAAFAGVMVACFTAVLWRSTDKLWEAGEKASLAQLRPWVFVKTVEWGEPDEEIIYVTFKNSGATPARNFSKSIVACALPVPFPSMPQPDIDEGLGTFLGPGETE